MNDRTFTGMALFYAGMLSLILFSILVCIPEPFNIPLSFFRLQVAISLIMIGSSYLIFEK